MRPSSTAPRRHRLAVTGVGLLVVTTACSATSTDGPGSAGTARVPDTTASSTTGSVPAGHLSGTTAPPAADAPIVYELEVDAAIACVDGATATVPVRWASRNAAQVAVLVDNAQVPGLQPASGATTVPVPCDGTSHVVVVTAIAADGRTAVDSRVVQTVVDAAGDQGT